MKIRFFILLLFIILVGCSDNSNQTNTNSKSLASDNNKNLQLNISILIDLSDRLVRNDVIPSQMERDLKIVRSILSFFREDMRSRGTFNSKSKIKVLFTPIPSDRNINEIAKNLIVDLSVKNSKEKKFIYDNIEKIFISNLEKIYLLTIQSNKWVGSDIWRFFKNDIDDLCIEKNAYRNILIILTDGYIYHKNSIYRLNNRTSYLTHSFLVSEGLIENQKWLEKFDRFDYGYISFPELDLSKIEILVLEINTINNSVLEEDIIKSYLNKWFKEMKVNRFEIFNTDLSTNTEKKIKNFLFNSF